MHTAAGGGYKYTVEHLVKKGADISIKDNNGVSVCDYTTVDLKYMYMASVIHGCECDLGITEHVHCNRQQNLRQFIPVVSQSFSNGMQIQLSVFKAKGRLFDSSINVP